MIFNWIEIHNFGSYRNTPRINLRPEKNRVVTLIGGKNGAGKSTFLEAIKCCLYGKRSRGLRARDVEYEEYLRKRQNYLQEKGEPSSIKVSFTFVNRGEEETYQVKRAWRFEGDELIHSLTILKNGFKFSAVNPEEWQNFLIDLIPPYILDLYLFDAEDMESLAINDGDNQFLGHSLKMMLGLHYSEQLISDLDLQLTRLEDGTESEVTDEFRNKKHEIQKLEERKEDIKQEMGSINSKLERARQKMFKIEEAFRAKGGQFAKQRDENQEEKKQLMEQLQKIEGQFQQLATGHLPFLISRKRLLQLQDRLHHEREFQTIAELKNMIQNRIDNLPKENQQRKEKLRIILKDLQEEFDVDSTSTLITKLSIKDMGVLENIIMGLDDVRQKVLAIVLEGQDIKQKLDIINSKLDLTPDKDDTEINTIFSKLQKKQAEITNLEKEHKDLEEEFNSTNYQQDLLESELQKLRLKLSSINKDKQVRDRIITAQKILVNFIEKQKITKIQELSKQIKKNYSKICRKGQAVSKVSIDPQSYTIRLYGPNNEIWNKDFLSVGERQLLALAILWSLATVSDRDLPFIIDTPLGKLDEEHRQGLVDDFFAVASSQVVILSTNKEIDEHLYHDLKPHISHSYLISFDNQEQNTLLEEGYFFN